MTGRGASNQPDIHGIVQPHTNRLPGRFSFIPHLLTSHCSGYIIDL
ncbi:hypothetical protein EniLVp02_0164 [Vibrio phage EniLVp02]